MRILIYLLDNILIQPGGFINRFHGTSRLKQIEKLI